MLHSTKCTYSVRIVLAKILISINPYDFGLGMYTAETLKKYEDNSLLEVPDPAIPPHCYETSARAYRDMITEGQRCVRRLCFRYLKCGPAAR